MDATYLQRFLSDSARAATRNEIRELLKLIARPEVISLAGGLPSPDTFPIELLADLLPRALRERGTSALQYGQTEGDPALRDALIRLMTSLEGGAFAGLERDRVLITSASQQALDLCGRVFVSAYDSVLVGLPSYLGALGAFTACGAKLSGVPLDADGMRTDLLEQRLVELRRRGIRPKLVYTVPDFGNPSGVTMSRARREELLAIAREFDLLVVEDSPYRQLRYEGHDVPTLFELDRDGRVISLFTVSKILSPGLRLGWVVADREVIARLVVAKQPVDLCTSGLSQLVALEFLRAGKIDEQLARIRSLYAAKCRTMLDALDEFVDPAWGVRWTRPEGGLFLWLTLPAGLDARELLERSVREENVAFVAGESFHCDRSGRNTLRLNFSYPSHEKLREGVRRLAATIGRAVGERGPAAAPARATEPALVVGGDHALVQLAWNLALSEVVE